MHTSKIFSARIRGLMKEKNLTIHKLAGLMKVSPASVQNWRDGQVPTVTHLQALADLLRVKMDEMLVNIEPVEDALEQYGHLHPLDVPANVFSKEMREHVAFMATMTPEKVKAIADGFKAYHDLKFGVQKKGVDNLPHSVNSKRMSNMEVLLGRLKRAVGAPGKRTELAKFMGVAPPRISEWLSGEREPSGEYTLMLLNWVEQQERQ
jgi:transcriptional regulator with XRE-family HTH domain